MNKKIILGIIAIVFTISALIVFSLKRNNNVEFKDSKVNQTVTFKILYDIQVKNKNLLPNPILLDKNLVTEINFIKEHKLFYITDFFEVLSKKNFKSTKTIYLYPHDFVQLKRIPRDLVTSDFLTARGVSENNAMKSVAILKQKSYTNKVCVKKLQRVFIGSEFNKDFFKKALPKLIYL